MTTFLDWLVGLPMWVMWPIVFAWVGLLGTIAVWPLLTAPACEATERALDIDLTLHLELVLWPDLPDGWTEADVEATLMDIEHLEETLL